jgi:hypothetical protein
MTQHVPRRTHPDADTAENGEIVADTPADIADATDAAHRLENHRRDADDAFGMRGDSPADRQ